MSATGVTVARRLVSFCNQLGVCSAHTISGGGAGALYSEFVESSLLCIHARHEEACVYQALEASLATGRPAVVCATTGEAVAKVMSAVPSARAEGGWVLIFSAYSNPVQFGRAAIQPTDPETLPSEFYRPGPLFDVASVLFCVEQLPWLLARLAVGVQDPTGFVGHIAVPRALQETPCGDTPMPSLRLQPPAPSPLAVRYCAEALGGDSFAMVVGHGARRQAAAVRALVELTGCEAFTTPRGKGIVDAPCIGLGGVTEYYRRGRPSRLLVLGSRLGEASCGWDPALLPRTEIVHVDLNPACFGAAYAFPTYGVQAEIGLFLEALLERLRETCRPAARRALSV